jgi:hypothetical protein
MSFITEAELREQWRLGVKRFDFPSATRFSPAALDFIRQWQLEVIVGGEPLQVPGTVVHHYSEGGLPYLAPKLRK